MEAMMFFVIWLGGALLHTLFDLRIKLILQGSSGGQGRKRRALIGIV